METVSTFPPSAGGYPLGPQHYEFSGLYHTACFLAPPASYPPLLLVHAGSLLSRWLGFAEVGLGANLTHWVTATSFRLAPSPRHGLFVARFHLSFDIFHWSFPGSHFVMLRVTSCYFVDRLLG